MDIKQIKKIIDCSFTPDDIKVKGILATMAKDPNVLPDLLEMITIERNSKKDLILDMGVELGRANTYIETVKDKNTNGFCKEFVLGENSKFYDKYSDMIRNPFKKLNMVRKLSGYVLYDGEDAIKFEKDNFLNIDESFLEGNGIKSGTIHIHEDYNKYGDLNNIIIVTEKVGGAFSLGFYKYLTIK